MGQPSDCAMSLAALSHVKQGPDFPDANFLWSNEVHVAMTNSNININIERAKIFQ